MTGTLAPRVARFALIVAALLTMVIVGLRVTQPRMPVIQAATGAPQDGSSDVAAIEAKVKAAPSDAANWLALGSTLFAANRFGDSAAAYRKAVQLAPTNGLAWSSLGEAVAATAPGTMPPEAKSAFDKALAIDPADPRARYFLGMAKDLAGDHRGALDDWFALLRDTPPGAGWEATVRATAQAVATRNKIDITARLKAITPQAAAAGPADPGAPGASAPAVDAAQTQMIAGMVDRLAERLKAKPTDVEGWTMLIRSYAVLGRKAEATGALKAGKSANPGATAQLDAVAASLGVAP